MIKKLIDSALNLSTDIHLSQEISLGTRVNPIGEKNINEVEIGIYPRHGARETRVAKGILGSLWASLSGSGGIEELFVESQRAAIADSGKVSLSEEIDSSFLEVSVALVFSSIKEHLHNFGHLTGSREETGMTTDTSHSVSVRIMDLTLNKSPETILFGRGDRELGVRIEEGVSETHRSVEFFGDKLVERFPRHLFNKVT